jgi:hypothetical protein
VGVWKSLRGQRSVVRCALGVEDRLYERVSESIWRLGSKAHARASTVYLAESGRKQLGAELDG